MAGAPTMVRLDAARRAALGLAVAKLVVHLVTLAPYGYFRDELYYLACADRPALGYVDHPPLSIWILQIWRAVAGDSVAAIRIVPAIAGAATVYVTGRVVMQLGGKTFAVVLACLAVLCMPARLSFDHYYSMNSLEALIWIATAWVALRVVATGSRAWWLTLGAALGIGMLDKWSVSWLGAGLGIGFLITPSGRRALSFSSVALAAMVAVAIAAPHFVWQAANGWPTLEFMRNALAHKYVRPSVFAIARDAVLMTNVVASILWLPGLLALVARRVRDASADGSRVLATAFATTVLLVTATRGKPEYLLAAFPLAFAVGRVFWESLLAHASARSRAVFAGGFVVALVGVTLVLLPLALPVLSEKRLIAYQALLGVEPRSSEKKAMGELSQFYADMHGWPELVNATKAAFETIEPEARAGAVVWAVSGGYGSAAAIDVLGRHAGLPRAISTHNAYWTWGYGNEPRPRVVIVLGDHPKLRELFEDVTLFARVPCELCMPYERDKPILVARGMRRGFDEIWPSAKHFE